MIPLLIDSAHLDSFCHMMRQRTVPDLAAVEGDVWKHELAETRDNGYVCDVVLAGGTAVIPVVGPIDYKQSFWTRYGYMASSEAIRQDFAKLMADDEVTRIVLDIDSPGGVHSGLPELAQDIFASRGIKQTVAVANPFAASAALWIGAAAEKFFSIGSGQVGSIGAVLMHSDYSRFFEAGGITNTILRSPVTKADFNPYEPLSDETRAHYQQYIAEIAGEFVASLGKFRGVPKAKVLSQFGDGRVLRSHEAVSAGLIDGLVTSVASVVGPRVRASKTIRLHPRLELARALGAGGRG